MTTTSTRKVQVGMQHRAASFEPASLNEEKRTVELVWTTGSKGLRSSFWSDPYHEELEVSETAVRLGRLQSGAPLLNSHRSWGGVESVHGVVESARIEGGKGYATVRFDDDEASDAIFRKVKNGIVRSVSVGYQIHKYKDVSKEGDRYKTLRAVDWEPMELSVVPIPFDAQAQVRSGETTTVETEIESPELPDNHRSQDHMDVTTKTPEAAAPVVDAAKERAEAKAAERKRAADIMAVCRKVDMADLAEGFIDADKSVEEVRAAIIDKLAEKSERTAVKGGIRVEAGQQDETQTRKMAMESALLHRFDPKAHQLHEAGRDYRSMSLVELARVACESSGINVRGMSKMQIAERALHSTSDFPEILANVASKSLRAAYEAAPKTYAPFVREVEVPDFKSIKRVQLGEAPQLAKVNEHGEFTRGTIAEGAESYSVSTYGKVVGITRQVIINDDLDAFTRVPQMFGMAAANKESDLVWSIFTTNAAMADTVALFHDDHDNLGTGGSIDVTTLTELRKLMRLQKGLDGRTVLNLQPRYLIVPAALETVAQQYLASDMVAAQASNVNPFKSSLQLIVEPRLDATDSTDWFMAADPSQIDIIEVAYLQGQRGVYIETRNGFDVDGVEIKARLDVGAAVIDYRGLAKNEGE